MAYKGAYMLERGFYIIKDSFFEEMNDSFLKGNKSGNRPHYYCFKDSTTSIYWVIPMSSRLLKYEAIIARKVSKYNQCDTIYIATLDNGQKSVFLIQDMFPITEEYIERQYTINGNHLRITSERTEREITKKARTVLALIKKGIKFTYTQPDVILIYNILKQRFEEHD